MQSEAAPLPVSRATPQPLELAVIVPTFCEAANIAPLIAELDRHLAGVGWEAIFVDDSSPDGTAEVVREHGRTDPRVRILERVGRRGLASATAEGMLSTAAPVVAVIDADLQHDVSVLKRMLSALTRPDLDMVVASRFVAGGDAAGLDEGRIGASRAANAIARRLLSADVHDPMSGCFMLRTETLRGLAPQLSGIGFKILVDLLAAAKGRLKVAEIPINFRKRAAGQSKLDHVIAFEFLVALYDQSFGRIVPTRFMLFVLVGLIGVGVHMTVLTGLLALIGFVAAHTVATGMTITFNFFLNNLFTYRDQRLRGAKELLRGWISFCLICGTGALANIGIASFLVNVEHDRWTASALLGIAASAIWNFALSSRFTWGRY